MKSIINICQASLKPLTREAVAEISQWEYEFPYDAYSFRGHDDAYLLDEALWGIEQFCLTLQGRILGQVACQYEGKDLWVGWSMAPELCGKGSGAAFVSRCVQEICRIKNCKGRILLRVVAWNTRAIKAYEKAGFRYVETILDEIAFSDKMEDFWVMEFLVQGKEFRFETNRQIYIGFKGKNNPSAEVVSRIKGERLLLTNSYSGLHKDIANLTADFNAAYLFGIDKELVDAVRIECCSENAGTVLETNLHIERIADIMGKNGVNCTISNVPTNYLCNDAYFCLLKRFDRCAVLIHIPGLKNMTESLIGKILKSIEELR